MGRSTVVWAGALAVSLTLFLAPTALAVPVTGPVWHVNGSALGSGSSEGVVGALLPGTEAKMYGEIATVKFRIDCTEQNFNGSAVITGVRFGSGTLEFAGCSLYIKSGIEYISHPECEIKPAKGKAEAELWYEGPFSGGSENIIVVFSPASKEAKMMAFEVVSTSKEKKCLYAGTYWSEGDIGAKVSPREEEVLTGNLTSFTTPTYSGYRPLGPGSWKEVTIEPKFAGKPSKLEAAGTAKLISGNHFGVWQF
jgi:hypothetical protein